MVEQQSGDGERHGDREPRGARPESLLHSDEYRDCRDQRRAERGNEAAPHADSAPIAA